MSARQRKMYTFDGTHTGTQDDGKLLTLLVRIGAQIEQLDAAGYDQRQLIDSLFRIIAKLETRISAIEDPDSDAPDLPTWIYNTPD